MQSSAILTKHPNLTYLANKPKTVWWKVIAPEGARISPIQRYDLIYDEKDLRIRRILSEPEGSEKIRRLI